MPDGRRWLRKSRVINAMRELAQQWGLADTLCVAATTGIAACLIGGLTWHKATGQPLRIHQEESRPSVVCGTA